MFSPVALQRSKIVAITQLREQILEDSPIANAGGATIGAAQMIFQVLLDPVVVEQSVVNIDQENDRRGGRHSELRRRSSSRAGPRSPDGTTIHRPQPRKFNPLDPNRFQKAKRTMHRCLRL